VDRSATHSPPPNNHYPSSALRPTGTETLFGGTGFAAEDKARVCCEAGAQDRTSHAKRDEKKTEMKVLRRSPWGQQGRLVAGV